MIKIKLFTAIALSLILYSCSGQKSKNEVKQSISSEKKLEESKPDTYNTENLLFHSDINNQISQVVRTIFQDSKGDIVIDTPATYQEVNLCIDNSTNPPTLEYLFSNEVVDNVGVPYVDIDVNNIMDRDFREAYFLFRTNFTDGQAVRMRETIDNEPDLQAILTEVASLYEPS